VGASRVEEDRLGDAKRALGMAAASKARLHLPEDHVCAAQFEETSPARVVDGDIPEGLMGLDIGPRTRAAYAGVLKAAKTIVWNGPMGVFEWEAFAAGTKEVARAIADATKAGATSIVGGGDSAAAVEKFGLASAMSHVSTGGGASLEMLEGKRFESVDLLDEA
jgi:3-phosphoglycerate kinase